MYRSSTSIQNVPSNGDVPLFAMCIFVCCLYSHYFRDDVLIVVVTTMLSHLTVLLISCHMLWMGLGIVEGVKGLCPPPPLWHTNGFLPLGP